MANEKFCTKMKTQKSKNQQNRTQSLENQDPQSSEHQTTKRLVAANQLNHYY